MTPRSPKRRPGWSACWSRSRIRDLCTKSGAFAAFKKKGKWVDAAKREGLAKADGERLNTAAEGHYAACCEAWQTMLQNVASRVLADLIAQVQPVLQRFRDYKRSSGPARFRRPDLCGARPAARPR